MLKVRYHTHHLELSGYGRAAAGYLAALNRVGGVEIEVSPVVRDGDEPQQSEVDVAIYHTTPGRLSDVRRSPAKRHVALTTWETEPLPAEFANALRKFDAVIVPSIFCRNLIESAWHVAPGSSNIHVVPHAFDPEVWQPRASARAEGDVLTFYSIGAWGERKNTLGLLKAYLHTFVRSDKTRLVLVVDKVHMPAIHSVLARSLLPRDELPGLIVPDHRLSDDEIVQLHRDGHCFVTATRSEGFGLPIFEAAVMGKPVISPAWGGQFEFLEGYRPWRRVWHALTPVYPGEDSFVYENGAARLETALPNGANCRQLWAEPSLDRLAWDMRMVHEDFRAGRLADYHLRRPWFEKHYSLDAIGTLFINTLKEIFR